MAESQPAPAPTARSWTSTDLAPLCVVLIWGMNFTVVKVALGSLTPLTFNTLRFSIATALLLLIMRLRGESFDLRRADILPVIFLGFCGHTLYQAFFINGLARTTPAITALLMATSPLFVAIYGYLLRIERARPLVLAGIGLSFVGVLLVIIGGQGEINLRNGTLVGDLFALVAAMMWAGYTLGGKPLLGRYSPLKLNAMTMVPGTFILALISAPQIAGQNWAAVTPEAWGALAYSTLFAVVVGYVLWYTSVQRVGSARTAIYSNVPPIIAAITGWLFLGDRLTPWQLGGATIVIAGILLTRRGRSPAR